jgi:hypothetical protein
VEMDLFSFCRISWRAQWLSGVCPLSVASLSVCLSASNVLLTRTQTNINEHVLHSEKREARSIKTKAICD